VAPCCCEHSMLDLSTQTLLPCPACFVICHSTVKEIVGLLHQDGARSVSLLVPRSEVRRGAGAGRSAMAVSSIRHLCWPIAAVDPPVDLM
jgi:hypothetical protein